MSSANQNLRCDILKPVTTLPKSGTIYAKIGTFSGQWKKYEDGSKVQREHAEEVRGTAQTHFYGWEDRVQLAKKVCGVYDKFSKKYADLAWKAVEPWRNPTPGETMENFRERLVWQEGLGWWLD